MTRYICSTWSERDRKNVTLEREDGTEVFALWDDEVDEAIEDGYLPTPRCVRPTNADWLPCALVYAESQGLINEETA